MTRPTHPSTFVRISAVIAAGGLAVMSGAQLYWALGGTWALDAASGGERNTLSATWQIASGMLAVALFVAGLGVLGRAGFWGGPRLAIAFARTTWLAAIGLAAGSILDFLGAGWELVLFGPVAVLLAFCCYVVARDGVLGRTPRKPLPPFPASLLLR